MSPDPSTAEDQLGDDVLLNLARSAVDSRGPRIQEQVGRANGERRPTRRIRRSITWHERIRVAACRERSQGLDLQVRDALLHFGAANLQCRNDRIQVMPVLLTGQ